MGSFSIWHWIIVLALVGGVVFLIRRARHSAPSNSVELEGIRGWLAWLAIGQVVGLFRLIVSFIQNFKTYGSFTDAPEVRVAMYSEIALNLGLIALATATTMALFSKKKSFVALFQLQWLAIPATFILNILIVSFAFAVSVGDIITTDDVRKTALAFIAGGVWVWYTRVSKRVENTMVN